MTDEGLANLLATVPDLDGEKASLLASILLADPQDFEWNEPRSKLTRARVKPSSLQERRKTLLGWWNKSLASYPTKSAGEPCEQGETAAKTGCIPITPVAPHVGPSPLEGPRYGAKVNSEKAKVGQAMSSTPQTLAEIKKKCGIEKNWVWNYVNDLVKNGFVEKVGTKYKKKKTIPPPTDTTGSVTPPKVEPKPEPPKTQTLGEKYGVGAVTEYNNAIEYATDVYQAAMEDPAPTSGKLDEIYDQAKKEWQDAYLKNPSTTKPEAKPEPAKKQTLGEKYGVSVSSYDNKYSYGAEVSDTAKAADNNLSLSQLTSIYEQAKKEWDAAQAGGTPPPVAPPAEPAKPAAQAAPSPPAPEPAKSQPTPSWVPQAKPYDEALKEAKSQDPHAGAWGPKAKGNVSYGAVLINDKGQVLIREPANHWNGEHWTFAKGGSDPGDLPADTAVRELLEETGYKGSLVEPLPGVHKEGKDYWNNYYYVAKAEGEPGNFDHETWSTKWVSPDEAADYIKKSTNKDARDRDLSVLSSLQAMNATKTGFTGKIVDALGREVCFDAGKKIECPKAAEPAKVEPVKDQTLGEKYGVSIDDYSHAYKYADQVLGAAKLKDPALSLEEGNNVYDQAFEEWKSNKAGKPSTPPAASATPANPFPAGSKQASAFDKVQAAFTAAKAGNMPNPYSTSQEILNGPDAGMSQQQKHDLLNKLGIPSQMGDSTTSQLTGHLNKLSAGKNPSASAAKPAVETKKPLDPNATEIPHSLYTGPGKDWPGLKSDPSIVYEPQPGEESSPLFKQYKDDEERKPWFTSSSGVTPSFIAHANKVEKNLTAGEKKAVKSYTGHAYTKFNEAMRKCPDTLDCLSPDQKKMAENLEKAIAKGGVFKQPITAWRKLTLSSQETADFVQVMENALKSGADVRMPSIKSFSVHPKGWSGNVCLEVRARSGVYVEHYSSNPGEYEVLHGHNTRYKVVGIKEVPWAGSSGKKKIIQLEELTP